AEAVVDEDRDRRRARVRKLRREARGIRIGAEVSRRGRPALDLCDRGETGCSKCVPEAAHYAITFSLEKATSRSRRSAAAPESIVRRATSSPSRRSSACPAAAIAPAALSKIALRRPPSAPAKTSR